MFSRNALIQRRQFLLASLLLQCWFSLAAQAAPILKADSEYLRIPVNAYVDVYLDESRRVGLQQLLDGDLSRQFAPLTTRRAGFGFSQSALWMRMSVRNDSGVSDRYTVQFRPIDISELQVYEVLPESGGRARLLYDFAEREQHTLRGMTPGLLISLGRYEPGELKTIYFRMTSDYPLNINAQFLSAQSLGKELTAENGFYTFLLGLLWSVSLLTLACVFFSHETVFAYAAAHSIASIGYLRSAWGYPAFLIFDQAHYHGNSTYLFGMGIAIFSLLVSQRVLQAPEPVNRGTNILRAVAVLLTLASLSLWFLGEKASFLVFYLSSALAVLACLICVLKAYTREHTNYLLLLLIVHSVHILTIAVNTMTAIVDLSTLETGDDLIGGITVFNVLTQLVALTLFYNANREKRIENDLRAEFGKELVNSQTALLSRLTHQIRTPMAGVLGMTELLRSTRLSETQSEYADSIDRSSQQLLHIIDDVTAFAHIQNNTLPVRKQSFSVLEMLDELMLAFAPEAERRNVELVSFIQPGQPNYITADLIRIRHIISNLLSHSVAQLRDGEVLINVEVKDNELRLAVEDNGPGIDQEELALMFLSAEELPSVIPQEGGIGLPLCRRIAEALGGELRVNSQRLEGTRFELSLPVEEGKNPAAKVVDVEQLRELRVLVVDDSSTYCDVIERQISHWGTQVDSCLSGSEAIALLRAKENIEQPYKVLLVDYSMPGMNGMQLAERIQHDDLIDHENLIIFMLTGLNTTPDLAQAYRLGIRRILHKPLTSRALQEVMLEEMSGVSVAAEEDTSTDPDLSALKAIKVLLAEDNDVSARVTERMLHRLGVSSELVVNGEDALRAIQREKYDLVLMDCEMPLMDGFEVTELVRTWEQESGRPRTIIVALTAHLLEQLEDRILAAGMDDQESKPLRIHELQSLMKRWVPAFRAQQH